MRLLPPEMYETFRLPSHCAIKMQFNWKYKKTGLHKSPRNVIEIPAKFTVKWSN